MGVSPLIHQPSYSLLNRWIEAELLDTLEDTGMGCIAFSALAQGLLSDKYLAGIPQDARINRAGGGSLKAEHLSDANLARVRALNDIAQSRGQSLAQMAVAWVLRDARVSSALIGASRPEQITELAGAVQRLEFSADELAAINQHAVDGASGLSDMPSSPGLRSGRMLPPALLALGAIALWGTLAALGVALAHVPPFLLTGLALCVG
eukprot:gene4597-6089_t